MVTLRQLDIQEVIVIKVDFRPVKKELEKIPSFILLKLLRWAKGVEDIGIEEMRKIPGFHDEPLKGEWIGCRSIRLNKGYRAIYYEIILKEDSFIRILTVSKHEY